MYSNFQDTNVYLFFLIFFSAANDILHKSSYARSKREDSEKEKRSIDEDSELYDPGDGKELLAAYLSNVDLYNRQTRSVDDEEEDDDGKDLCRCDWKNDQS